MSSSENNNLSLEITYHNGLEQGYWVYFLSLVIHLIKRHCPLCKVYSQRRQAQVTCGFKTVYLLGTVKDRSRFAFCNSKKYQELSSYLENIFEMPYPVHIIIRKIFYQIQQCLIVPDNKSVCLSVRAICYDWVKKTTF